MHFLNCLQAGYKPRVIRPVLLSLLIHITVALLSYVPIFVQKGLKELWVRAGRGNTNTTRFVPLHILYERLGGDV